ncbi:hypothetical protein GX917_01370 [Candidatus Falkowbacteria bacterium]|jgi:hypothetical protein|nr:hypothetical protein [Candidatus Falkowbacteria bacterium]
MKMWKEKWNYSPVFVGDVSEQTKNDFSLPVIKELYNISSLPLNDAESGLISKILKVSNELFKINDIMPINICREQVRILHQSEFQEKVATKNTDQGKCLNGYIYVCRNNDISIFVSDLVHELSHLLSFYSLEIEESGKKRYINLKQSGYSIKGEGNIYNYDGLNEAVTELWSKIILQQLFNKYPTILGDEEKDKALNYYAYPYHVALVEEIIFNLTDKNSLIWPLFKSYFDGSADFLRLLEEKLPKAFIALKGMNNDPQSVFETAYNIGGKRLLQKIKSIKP